METDNYMGSYVDAQHYLAVKILYELNPNLPLYRLFPPYHRELWQSWSESVQSAKDTQQREEDEALQSKIQELVDAAPKRKKEIPATKKSTEQTEKTHSYSKGDPAVLDNWEDDEIDEAFANIPVPRESNLVQSAQGTGSKIPSAGISRNGKAMKEAFFQRTKTPAYQSMLEARSALPMYAFREQILKTIQHNAVTILCAEVRLRFLWLPPKRCATHDLLTISRLLQTGAGKTTQCPQFILEECLAKGRGDQTSVICTQPRRVAAISVAERVSEEMAEPSIGQTVGYQIRLEARRSAKTRLLFCTTGELGKSELDRSHDVLLRVFLTGEFPH